MQTSASPLAPSNSPSSCDSLLGCCAVVPLADHDAKTYLSGATVAPQLVEEISGYCDAYGLADHPITDQATVSLLPGGAFETGAKDGVDDQVAFELIGEFVSRVD